MCDGAWPGLPELPTQGTGNVAMSTFTEMAKPSHWGAHLVELNIIAGRSAIQGLQQDDKVLRLFLGKWCCLLFCLLLFRLGSFSLEAFTARLT